MKRQVDWQLRELKTGLHRLRHDPLPGRGEDWRAYQENGVLDYLLELKRAGVVRHIGLSSHTPELARKILDTGLVEQLMFSINPAYDCSRGSTPSAAPESGWTCTAGARRRGSACR